MKVTEQIEFWEGDFGKEYTDRNTMNQDDWDKFYIQHWGHSKVEMNERIMAGISKQAKILEVGCNTGQQLLGLQRSGFTDLYGVELQAYAVEMAKKMSKDINIITGSGFDLPFKNGFFDITCTNGVLIHISPNDHKDFMSEMYRCTNKYIMGFEYYGEKTEAVNYRGNTDRLWKADFANIFMEYFPDLKLVKKDLYPYKPESMKHLTDCFFLLEKTGSK